MQTKEPAEPQAPADGEEAPEADRWNVTVCGLSSESLETLTAYLEDEGFTYRTEQIGGAA